MEKNPMKVCEESTIENEPTIDVDPKKAKTLSHNKKHFHVDANTEEWETWRRLASFRYQADGEQCFEVLRKKYETVRFCTYNKGVLWVFKSQGNDLDPAGEVGAE